MRTHVLLILVLAILASSGCSARRGGTWWPFGANQYVETGEHQSEQEMEVAQDVVVQQPRLSFLNPLNWFKTDQFQYESEVTDSSGCRDCGVAGNFPGNGRCDDCLQKTVNKVLGSGNKVNQSANSPGEYSAPVDPTELGSSGVPSAPNMDLHGPQTVVKPHPVLSDGLQLPPKKPDLQQQKFEPVPSELIVTSSKGSDTDDESTSPQVPTTVMQDQRMNQYQSPIPNWDGWEGEAENSKPARVVNQFNDEIDDWARYPKPKSIAIQSNDKKGGEPDVEIEVDGNDDQLVEIKPDQPQDYLFPVSQENPKFEQFTLDDLFPADMQPSPSQHESALPKPIQTATVAEPSEPTPSQLKQSEIPPAKSVMEEDDIEWGLPNHKPAMDSSRDPGEKEYSLVDESNPDGDQSGWGEDRYDGERSRSDSERSEYDRERNDDQDEFEDESLYEDEHGEYDQDADFSQRGQDDFGSNLAARSERDIIEELRNSTVPNQIIFDNTPQIPQQRSPKPYKPVVLTAKPVPHYQELRHLARMKERDGVVDMSNQDVVIESLPEVGKTPATPASSRRVVEETDEFDFQPLPNLLLPTPLGVNEVQMEDFESQVFDPDFILNTSPPMIDQDKINTAMGVPVHSVEGTPKRSAVPIILKAAPTLTKNDEADQDSAEKSNAKIRFIKPSFQRKLND